MTAYAKPTVRSAWGETATGTDLTDPGDTYASKGWQLGVKPPRQYFNWVLNYTFEGMRYLCQQGLAAWDAAETYPTAAIVYGPDTLIYKSRIPGNVNNAPSDVGMPSTDWDSPAVPTPLPGDNSVRIANTKFVAANYIAKGAGFGALAGSIANGQVPVGAVVQWEGSLSIAFPQLVGQIANGQVPLGAVQQFQSALSIGWGQITGTKNADLLQGLAPSVGAAGGTIVARDGTGEIYAQNFNQSSPNNENPSISQLIVTTGIDGFFRKASTAAVKAALGALGLSDFPSGNGFFQLPNEQIVQYGQVAVSGTTSFNFPVSFPNGAKSLVMGVMNSTNQIFVVSMGTTGATLSNGSATVNYIATGF